MNPTPPDPSVGQRATRRGSSDWCDCPARPPRAGRPAGPAAADSVGDWLLPRSRRCRGPNVGGGWIPGVHLLSDQQWCLHWLVYVDANGSESVVTTAEPLGFKLGLDDWEKPIPPVVPLDGSYDLRVCADSVNEFLYRFWIENELFYAGGKATREPLLAYASAFRAQGPSGQPGASPE
jgi:hypothetical protein